MPRPLHNGRRGSQGLSADWGRQLAKAASRSQTGTCEIHAPDVPGPFDPNTGSYSPIAGALRYAGPCRVQQRTLADPGTPVTEQNLPDVYYLVQLPWDVDNIAVHDVVTVLTGDPMLEGQKIYVQSVLTGTQRTTRDIICTDDQSI